ncbi:hypothetical protein GUITHDRAFT_122115 [Guillardia theta CCMP2712]|uniref:Amine oxidase domain-containing protein n=1 Tax=Guillardia theta (strain CCMP2712) TaxID=905079 RepID=L1I605_GUITC|nr:hypothetical protein GUITHDRAFT_122115 [Guillardia theta CCMP2712]EKX31703.1 hypothetical protein GUITHDRAFT_122115 [Guillardia theta CCMP2712]|eukprot:XP_005818683.1 hypothetical protein GUITHDRAFT_122115 [Guillardia theta CCMP2712]
MEGGWNRSGADAKIAIIGAGTSGITAANHLKTSGYNDVVLLEANSRLGGRVMSTFTCPDTGVKEFASVPLELGPEFIHGDQNNLLLDYIKKHYPSVPLLQAAWPNYFYFGKEGKLVGEKEAEQDKELMKMIDTFEMTGDLDADLIPEETLLQVKVGQGGGGGYGSGENMAKGLDIRLNWEVAEINYEQSKIKFTPPLPALKAEATKLVKMGNAMKVILRVKTQFWPDDLWDVVCSDSLIPEFWLTPPAQALKRAKMPEYYIVGFVSGDRASRLAKLPHAEIARKMMLQLDAIFGSSSDPNPATRACTGFLVKDWAQERLARGAYTFPSPDALGKREALASPIDSRIFFSGEATQTGVNPCLQAAMETGQRAAKEAMDSLNAQKQSEKRLLPVDSVQLTPTCPAESRL